MTDKGSEFAFELTRKLLNEMEIVSGIIPRNSIGPSLSNSQYATKMFGV